MIIGKHFEFEASHQLPANPIYGACANMHGHTYKLTVEIEGDISFYGWVMNFKELKDIVKQNIIDILDHKHINNALNMPITTAEHIVEWMYDQIRSELKAYGVRTVSIILYETTNSYAKITRDLD
jgi:6-pyruvoyltetrahydropterin/6-carboxytetrahydropterin synthase